MTTRKPGRPRKIAPKPPSPRVEKPVELTDETTAALDDQELPKVSVEPVEEETEEEEAEDVTGFGPNSVFTPPEDRTASPTTAGG